jgi:hypothetical protein
MSIDEGIVKLKASAEAGKVYSFTLKAHGVAELSGLCKPEASHYRINVARVLPSWNYASLLWMYDLEIMSVYVFTVGSPASGVFSL